MNIPLNYYFADDFPEIAAEQEGIEDGFVNAKLEELLKLYSSDSPSLRELESIVHRLFRREFPIRKHPQMGYANSGETVREFVLTRFAKLKNFVRSMTFQSRMDEHEIYTFCMELKRQIMSSQYDARRIIFFEKEGEMWWTIHPSNKESLLRPDFAGLFFGNKEAHRALKAAIDAEIIDKKGKSKLGERKIIPAIVQFWEAVSDPKFELTHHRTEKDAIGQTYLRQCQAIAEQFGTTISQTAIYDHAGKKAGKYFTAVACALGGT